HDHDPITFYEADTLIHKAGYDAHFLAAIDLMVTRAAQQSGPPKITVVPAWRMHAVYNVQPEAEMAQLVKRHTDKLNAELEVKIDGQPLEPERLYKVAAIDYIAGGGDGFEVLKKAKSLIDPMAAKLTASQVMDYIAAKSAVSPKIEGRIVQR